MRRARTTDRNERPNGLSCPSDTGDGNRPDSIGRIELNPDAHAVAPDRWRSQ